MPLGTSVASRPALINCTNVYTNNIPSPWTVIQLQGVKRPSSEAENGGLKKRLKVSSSKEQPQEESIVDEESNDDEGDSDEEMEDICAVRARARRGTVFGMMNAAAMGHPGSRQGLLSTRPILQTFVSSHKADVFKCYSVAADTYLTPPYACAYSNSARNGGIPLLAIATEQGTVHILDTTKRRDWDYEPQRTTLQPHDNGIFDLKWNHSDTLLASASGDLTTRISCPTTQRSLYTLGGHNSTVKCVSWDPNHQDLLSTGGRDGSVHIWDLRVRSGKEYAGVPVLSPVLSIRGAHDEEIKGKCRKRSLTSPCNKTITSLSYPESQSYNLISSGSNDGILRCWDLRLPLTSTNNKSPCKRKFKPTNSTATDPTTLNGSRPRGIMSLTQGTGPTAGLLFALAADSRIYTYSTSSTLNPLSSHTYSHKNMQTHSFYVRIATSPCGRWLVSGGAGAGSAFLYDIGNAARMSSMSQYEGHSRGVQLRGQTGEVAAVDWADGMLATCADDGTVRVWRPDGDVKRRCAKDPEELKWEYAWSVDS